MDFKELIGSLLDTNKRPIISVTLPSLNHGIEQFSRHVALHHCLRDYCSSVGVAFIGNFDTFWDGIHPNHLGSWILPQHYMAALRQWLLNDPSPAHLIPTIVSLSCHNVSANVHYPSGVGRYNVSNLIYVPLAALNVSADSTAIVCSNHMLMNQSYTVSTEAVCPSRKSTVCSSPCTNINNQSMSTSAKLPSKARKIIKHPKKVLKLR
jgi:hypothetical protein